MSNRVKNLFEYLLALNNLTHKPVRNYNSYDNVWLDSDLQDMTEGCYLFDDGVYSDAILEIHRQDITSDEEQPPRPDPHIKDWIDVDYYNPKMSIRLPTDRLYLTPDNFQVEEKFSDESERVHLFTAWKEEWDDWAQHLIEKRATKKLYEELFGVIQELQREGDRYELVLGNWLFTWKHPNKEVGSICHPLFTLKADIRFNPDDGVITILPTQQGYRMEMDMLAGINLPNASQITELNRSLTLLSYGEDIDHLARQFVQLVDASGKEASDANVVLPKKEPEIYDRFMLLLRKKDAQARKKDLEMIVENVNAGSFEIPLAISSLVGDEVTSADSSNTSNRDWKHTGDVEDDTLYFPLPANDDQKEIIRRINNNYGVTVQGPPGTGKTHTIANIVSHFLAQGKKVLITSETENPLRVLKDKIPEEIQDLCISVLGGGRDALSDIQQSVKSISEKLGSLSTETLEKENERAKRDLDVSKRKEAELRNRLMDYTRSETEEIDYKGDSLTKKDVAEMLTNNTVDYSWILDKVVYPAQFPLSEAEFIRLWELKNVLSRDDLKLMDIKLPSPEIIKSDVDMAAWIQDVQMFFELIDVYLLQADIVWQASLMKNHVVLEILVDVIEKRLPMFFPVSFQ